MTISDDWKATNKTIQILKDAEERKYGVVAAIVYNVENIIGIVKAAEALKSPIILQLFPWAITYSDGLLVKLAAEAAKNATVPVAVHLDHAQDEELIKLATELPFDSIMIDMSHHPKEENLKKTAELVKICNVKKIATEAEPGRIEGAEDGLADTVDLEGLLTTPEEIDEFLATGIDFIAPAIGNIHGDYGPKGPRPYVDVGRLKKIVAYVNKRSRVVLHGTNDFPKDLFQECIAAGVSKINVNKQLLDPYLDHLKLNASKLNLTTLIEDGTVEVQKGAELLMNWCLSSGKA
ncbi:ketose-bisphosphate aldolase [Dipodascopsis uninucleata]